VAPHASIAPVDWLDALLLLLLSVGCQAVDGEKSSSSEGLRPGGAASCERHVGRRPGTLSVWRRHLRSGPSLECRLLHGSRRVT